MDRGWPRPGRKRLWYVSLAALPLLAAALPGRADKPPVASQFPDKRAELPRGSGPMPDSVLAIVDRNRRITDLDFRSAWDRVGPPARPDTLTPKAAREFLDLLIGKEALGARALREPFKQTTAESLEFWGLRDRLTIRAALDSALGDARRRMGAAGDTASEHELGFAARDSTVARMGVQWNEPALAKLAKAFEALPRPSPDSSLMAQFRVLGMLPAVDSAGRAAVLATALGRPFKVAELLDSWAHVNPLERPRVRTADQVRDLVKNALFERALRAEAQRRHLDERPDIARALAAKHEFQAVDHYVAREVYARIDTTTATLERFYRENATDWALPTRVRIALFTIPDRKGAAAMAVRLANPAEAETLLARGARSGARYQYEVHAGNDSMLFARALGAGMGAVLGPDSLEEGWRVARVLEVMPPRLRTFAEARGLVYQRWYGEEGERLMLALLDRVRRATSVVINERALAKIRPW